MFFHVARYLLSVLFILLPPHIWLATPPFFFPQPSLSLKVSPNPSCLPIGSSLFNQSEGALSKIHLHDVNKYSAIGVCCSLHMKCPPTSLCLCVLCACTCAIEFVCVCVCMSVGICMYRYVFVCVCMCTCKHYICIDM